MGNEMNKLGKKLIKRQDIWYLEAGKYNVGKLAGQLKISKTTLYEYFNALGVKKIQIIKRGLKVFEYDWEGIENYMHKFEDDFEITKIVKG